MAEQESHNIITVVLTADNHLGYSAFGQHPRKREERLQRLRHAFQRATDFAVGQGVDLFIQAGDLFDTANPAEQDRSFVAARLAELRQGGIRTFVLGGLHDTPADAQSYMEHEDRPEYDSAPQMSYARLGALHYFPPLPALRHVLGTNPSLQRGIASTASQSAAMQGERSDSIELEPVMVDVHGILLGICGLGVLANQQGDPLAKTHVHSDIERAAISLLILHAPIEGLTSQKHDIRDSTSFMVARSTIVSQSPFHYILAGYHHDYQHVRIGNTDVIVAGATEHIDFNDPEDDPGFVFLGLAADGVRWCHHITVDALRLRHLAIHTAELWPDDSDATGINSRVPNDAILERLRPLCDANSMVQLQLVGELTRDEYHQLDLSEIRRYGEEHCFELALDESGLSLLPIDSRLAGESAERLSPREELVNLADEWIAVADDEQEKKALLATKEELLATLDRMKRS